MATQATIITLTIIMLTITALTVTTALININMTIATIMIMTRMITPIMGVHIATITITPRPGGMPMRLSRSSWPDRGGWRRGLSAVVAVGARPCSGAIIVLVFALAQGLFWVGVVSTLLMGLGTAITVAAIASIAVGATAWAARFAETRSGYGMLAMRGIEVGAAVVIIAFGALLLAGYVVTERLVGI
jgi:hypothetical protein